jgi:glycopeptide antibiotics resistance protein
MLGEGKAVLLLNLTAFIPMGFFICLFTKGKSKYKHVYLIVLIPIIIEVLQYIFATGALDINDIILNVISGIIGVTAYAIIHKIKQR